MVIEPLAENYGDVVTVNYYDMTDDNVPPEIKEFFNAHNYPFPLTFINQEPVSAGYISYFDISTKIDALLKNSQ